MSKITLEPNASGVGTFSIVSPDSNTNRTLTLPDEAGKLLSTGNNDPAEVFKQSNILSTVSESGGVPTGAIIERGSNANGEFVKYADGTMICTMTSDPSGTSKGGTVGSVPTSSSISQTLPATFVDTAYSVFGFVADSNGNGEWVGTIRNSSTTEFGYRIYARETGNVITAVVNLCAIGRWF